MHSWEDTGLHSKQINFLRRRRKARFYTDWVTVAQEQKGTTENKHCSIDTRQFTKGRSKEDRCSRWGKKN